MPSGPCISSSGKHVARRRRSDKSPDIVDTSWQASICNRRPDDCEWLLLRNACDCSVDSSHSPSGGVRIYRLLWTLKQAIPTTAMADLGQECANHVGRCSPARVKFESFGRPYPPSVGYTFRNSRPQNDDELRRRDTVSPHLSADTPTATLTTVLRSMATVSRSPAAPRQLTPPPTVRLNAGLGGNMTTYCMGHLEISR